MDRFGAKELKERHSSVRADKQRRETPHWPWGRPLKQIWRRRKLVLEWLLCWARPRRANGWRC